MLKRDQRRENNVSDSDGSRRAVTSDENQTLDSMDWSINVCPWSDCWSTLIRRERSDCFALFFLCVSKRRLYECNEWVNERSSVISMEHSSPIMMLSWILIGADQHQSKFTLENPFFGPQSIDKTNLINDFIENLFGFSHTALARLSLLCRCLVERSNMFSVCRKVGWYRRSSNRWWKNLTK